MTFDFDRIVSTLSRHHVTYVMIGGAAAVAHGSTLATEDIDLTPARDQPNLDRLGDALLELRARLRTANEPDGVELPCDGRFLAAMPMTLNLTTDAGDIDLALTPAGFAGGYDALAPRAIEIDFGGGAVVLVAALDDIIASKRAADRPKDRAALPYLEALADEIARGS